MFEYIYKIHVEIPRACCWWAPGGDSQRAWLCGEYLGHQEGICMWNIFLLGYRKIIRRYRKIKGIYIYMYCLIQLSLNKKNIYIYMCVYICIFLLSSYIFLLSSYVYPYYIFHIHVFHMDNIGHT